MLKRFKKPDSEFTIVRWDSDPEILTLCLGDETWYEAHDMNADELKEWADNCGLLDPDSGYYSEETGELDYESLREAKRDEEEEFPIARNTPTGRAYEYFSDFKHSDLKILK